MAQHFIVDIDTEGLVATRLIYAKTRNQAFQYVADKIISVRLAGPGDVYAMGKQSVELEDATTDKAAEATQAELRG